MSINEGYNKHPGDYNSGWFERYEQELEKGDTVSLQSIYPYIYFKLSHDFAFSRGNSIDIHDPLAINYFMGNFCYNQVIKDFQRSAIVMQTQTERVYFGSPSVCLKRMRILSRQTGKSADDFGNFISYLEDKVFQSRLLNFDERQKDTLGMILRLINQGVSAVALKMLNGYLKVRSGECDQLSLDGLNDINYLMRPDMSHEKGSTQIDILYGDDGKIQLYRREYLKVQKFDVESHVEPDERKEERYCLLMRLSRDGAEESSVWRLHFSVSNIEGNSRSENVSSSSSSQSKARQLGPVSSDRLSATNSISSGESHVSIHSQWDSSGKPNIKKSGVRRIRKSRCRPIRDLLYKRKGLKPPELIFNSADWLKQYEDYSKVYSTILFEEAHHYIDFKLSHDLSFSHDSCLETKDWVAINYFLGDFYYNRVRRGFNQNAIVLTTETEKLYFGTSVPESDSRSVNETDSYNEDFEAFISTLENKVFKRGLREFNNHQKQTLGVILRFLCHNNVVASKLLKMCIQTRSPSCDIDRLIVEVEGSTRIGIESKGNNIYLSKEENLALQKSKKESKLELGEDMSESWKMVTNIMQMSSMNSSNYNLHFSVLQNSRQDRLTLTPSDSSEHSFSFRYPGTTSHNPSTSCLSLKTEMYDECTERSLPDSILEVNEVKKDEFAVFPRRLRGTRSDELRDSNNNGVATVPGRVVNEVNDVIGFRWREFKKTHLHAKSGEWIAKDHLGI